MNEQDRVIVGMTKRKLIVRPGKDCTDLFVGAAWVIDLDEAGKLALIAALQGPTTPLTTPTSTEY